MLTQGTAITRVRDMLNESSARQWSDDQIRRWINDAVRDAARSVEYMETTDTIAIVAGTQTYDLSASISPAIARIHRVEFVATGDTRVTPLEYEDYSNMDAIWGHGKSTTSARPAVWTAWGMAPAIIFLLYPKPATNGTVTLYYYAVPDRLDETTTDDAAVNLSIPDGWENLILYYAEYHALRRDRDPRWQEAKQLYDSEIEKMISMTSRHSDQAGRLIPTGHGAVPGWLAGVDGY